jgi:non-ribosomal peptide synthetase component F
LNNFVHAFDAYFEGVSSSDNFLSTTNISFDVSIFELFLPLVFGASLVLYHNELIRDILDYTDYIVKHEITGLYIPPNILNEVYFLLKDKKNLKIDKLLVGVEAIKKETLDKYFLLNPNMHIVNGYGPTETTICCSALPYSKDLPIETDIVPIGMPLFNDHIYILDTSKKLRPVGLAGELYVTGNGVGAGYINNESETSKNYLPNIFDNSSEKMYKTGDIGKWNEDRNYKSCWQER